jgi:hypothetical protein
MNASNPAILTAMRGVRRSGPCITGGVSPSLHHARQSVTGPIFTGPALPTGKLLLLGFFESNSSPVGVPASSGPFQSQELTKASRRTPFSPALLSDSACSAESNRCRRMNASNLAIVTAMRGVRRSGPCIMGGVSPSLHHARQSVTRPIFTGPALPPFVLLQFGSRESNSTNGGVPASSGSSQSQELTKASRRMPLSPALKAGKTGYPSAEVVVRPQFSWPGLTRPSNKLPKFLPLSWMARSSRAMTTDFVAAEVHG